MRPQATKLPRQFPGQFDHTVQTLAHLRSSVEEVARRGSVRELGPGHVVIRVPFGKKRAMRRYIEPRKLATVRYDIRWISLREHWTLHYAKVILNFRSRIMKEVGRVSRRS